MTLLVDATRFQLQQQQMQQKLQQQGNHPQKIHPGPNVQMSGAPVPLPLPLPMPNPAVMQPPPTQYPLHMVPPGPGVSQSIMLYHLHDSFLHSFFLFFFCSSVVSNGAWATPTTSDAANVTKQIDATLLITFTQFHLIPFLVPFFVLFDFFRSSTNQSIVISSK
jgi:hypothetical protein